MNDPIIPPLDLMFFLTESHESPKHVGAIQVFELPKNAPKDYLLRLVEQFRAAPVVPPFDRIPHFPRLGMPRWRAGEAVEIDYHVRHSALPAPGTTAQLMEVVQRLHCVLLDRRRPCWMCQVIEGLEGNRFAIYMKVHHAYIDGMSGVRRMYGSLSASARSRTVVPPWSYQPPESKGRSKRSLNLGDTLRAQGRGAAQAWEFLAKMGLQKLRLRDSEAQGLFLAGRTRLNRPIEWDTRSAAVCTLPLDRVRAVGAHRDCTVNEVVLALIGAALDEYLHGHRERPRVPLVALCPMSLRAEGDATAATRVSAVHVRLGEPGAGLAERLDQVVHSSRASKDAVGDLSAAAMLDYAVVVFALWELLQRSGVDQWVAPSYNVLVSNVPGPGDEDMYLCGSRMVASYPISTLLPGVNLNATLLSHGNCLDFGLLGDRHALPDLHKVTSAMERLFPKLETAVMPASAPAKRRRRARAAG